MTEEADRIASEQAGQSQSVDRDAAGNELRPMTPRLMAQLFGVPALIVVCVITCALLVTLAFGWIAAGQEEPIGDLVARVSAGGGDKVLGVALAPRDKELWQAALELARRLEQPDKEIKPDERAALAGQLSAAIENVVASPRPYSKATRDRIGFMAMALGRLKEPSAVERFVSMLAHEDDAVRKAAVTGMAELGPIPEMRSRTAVLIPVLNDDPVPEVRLLAATALGQIAAEGDEAVIAALRKQRVDVDEVRWNVALALARLGDESGRLDVLEMLSRDYWKKQTIKDDPDSEQTRPITEAEISRNIRSTLAALDRVRDPEIRSAIRALAEDPDPNIVGDARELLRKLEERG